MFFTSGTTGYPKMTQLSCASYGLGHSITAKYWMDLTATDVQWCMSDPGWAKSAWGNVFSPWINGACVFIHSMPRMDPQLVLQVSPDCFSTTHTQYDKTWYNYNTYSRPRGLVVREARRNDVPVNIFVRERRSGKHVSYQRERRY